jgi:hypothetical protein
MALTGFSWFILGIWYGFGFCFCTEWHWQVRKLLGIPIQSYSYIHFLILEITGIRMNPQVVDTLVMIIFTGAFLLSGILNTRDYFISKKRNI